jgi:hypothetical protein
MTENVAKKYEGTEPFLLQAKAEVAKQLSIPSITDAMMQRAATYHMVMKYALRLKGLKEGKIKPPKVKGEHEAALLKLALQRAVGYAQKHGLVAKLDALFTAAKAAPIQATRKPKAAVPAA